MRPGNNRCATQMSSSTSSLPRDLWCSSQKMDNYITGPMKKKRIGFGLMSVISGVNKRKNNSSHGSIIMCMCACMYACMALDVYVCVHVCNCVYTMLLYAILSYLMITLYSTIRCSRFSSDLSGKKVLSIGDCHHCCV